MLQKKSITAPEDACNVLPHSSGSRSHGYRMKSTGEPSHCDLAVDLKKTINWVPRLGIEEGYKNRTASCNLNFHDTY